MLFVDSALAQLKTLDSGSSPEWRLSAFAIDETPAALLKTLDSVSVKNMVATLPIFLPHGMTAPRAGAAVAIRRRRIRRLIYNQSVSSGSVVNWRMPSAVMRTCSSNFTPSPLFGEPMYDSTHMVMFSSNTPS